MNLKVGRVCPQRAGLRMQNGSGALGTDAPYHYWVQGFNARIFRGILSLRERAGGGKLDVEPPSIVLLMTGVRTAGTLAVLLFLFLTAPFCGSSQQVLLTGAKVHTISGD